MGVGGGLKTRLMGPALGAAAAALVLFASLHPLYRQIELKTLDMRFGLRRPPAPSDLLLHVDIDDSSMSAFPEWPWPRERYGRIARVLKELGARAVFFDVEFSEASNPENDNALARALDETAFVYLPFRLELRASSPADPLEARVRQALQEDFEADAGRIAARLDVPQESVESKLMSLKNAVARRAGWELLREKGTLSAPALFARLLPNSDASVDTVERKMIPSAVDWCLATDRVLRLSSRPAPAGSGFSRAQRLSPPIAMLAEGAAGFGASNAPTDAEDGALRHVTLLFEYEGRLVPHLSLAGACWALGATMDNVEIVGGRSVVIHPGPGALEGEGRGPVTIPVDAHGRVLVNWTGGPRTPWPALFRHVPAGSLLELATYRENLDSNDDVFRNGDVLVDGEWTRAHDRLQAAEARREPSAARLEPIDALRRTQREVEEKILKKLREDVKEFSDKTLSAAQQGILDVMKDDLRTIPEVWRVRDLLLAREADLRERLGRVVRGTLCFVGMTASGTTDLKPTPLAGLFPGVGVHSAVINSILQRAFIYETAPWVGVLVLVAVGLGVGASAGMLSTRWSAAVSAGLLAGWTALAWALFAWLSVRVEMAGPVITGVLAYAAVTAWRHLTEERQKRHIRNAFQHYLAPAVVAQVIANPDLLKLGGERKVLTVFFSDVAGFTPISEGMKPEDLVTLLNEYLSEMSQVILDEGGYLNKYEGDMIMAVWGAPLDDPEHAAKACRAALECQRRLKDFNERLARENRPVLPTRIGLNSGDMLVGNMGSSHRLDYTVMGDNVNVGSRLEGANKAFGTEIMIGENTYVLVKDRFETRRLGLVAVKGRTKPVGAWELLAEKGKCPPLIARILPAYERGLAAYGEQKWDEAMAAFKECLLLHPHDGPSRAYLDRCVDLRSRPASAERWDGSFILESK